MKNKKHTKLAVLISALILIGVVITACGVGADGGLPVNGNDDGAFMDIIIADDERINVDHTDMSDVQDTPPPEIDPSDITHANPTSLLCHCGEHYIGDNLRQPTPPLNIREWNEVDREFLDSFGGRRGLTFVEHGDLSTPIPFVERWWGYSQLERHTMLLWTDDELFDVRIVALGFNDKGDTIRFYVRYELDNREWFAPGSLMMINANLLHYLIPRMGITFTDSHGNHHRMLIQENMRGGCFPLFNLVVHDENHFAVWDDSVVPEPFVMMEMGNFIIRGIGGSHVSFNPRQRSFYFAGGNFNVTGLHGEAIEGFGDLINNTLSIRFAVGRNEIILQHMGGGGALAGPYVFFEYEIGSGVAVLNNYPFIFHDNRHPPIEFEMPEEGIVQFAHLLLFAYELVNNHRNIFP